MSGIPPGDRTTSRAQLDWGRQIGRTADLDFEQSEKPEGRGPGRVRVYPPGTDYKLPNNLFGILLAIRRAFFLCPAFPQGIETLVERSSTGIDKSAGQPIWTSNKVRSPKGEDQGGGETGNRSRGWPGPGSESIPQARPTRYRTSCHSGSNPESIFFLT